MLNLTFHPIDGILRGVGEMGRWGDERPRSRVSESAFACENRIGIWNPGIGTMAGPGEALTRRDGGTEARKQGKRLNELNGCDRKASEEILLVTPNLRLEEIGMSFPDMHTGLAGVCVCGVERRLES